MPRGIIKRSANPERKIQNKPYAYFNSSSGKTPKERELRRLSNFWRLDQPLELWGLRWRTSEHAYQAHAKVDREDWPRLAVGGDLDDIDKLAAFYPDQDTAWKKINHWYGKGVYPMAGVVAKMAVNPAHNRKLQPPLRLLDEHTRLTRMALVPQKDLWGQILAAKAAASAVYAETLKDTGTLHLVEFDRGAKRRSLAGDPPFWTGLVDDDGTLHGENFMGRCQMWLRAELARAEQAGENA